MNFEQQSLWTACEDCAYAGAVFCYCEPPIDLEQENRRMKFMLKSVLDPTGENTLWDRYTELDENFWNKLGL